VRVHYGEGRSVPHRPRVMRGCREVTREALTGVCAGQVVSGESNAVRGADAVVAAEGNRGESGSARIRTTPRRLAGRVSYRLTPRAPNNQNAEVSHNAIRMANSTPPAIGSAQPG
jgi:hypothetical protein